MNIIEEVKEALKKHRYTIRSFGLCHGFGEQTMYKTLYRSIGKKRVPRGKIGKQIFEKIKAETGYDLESKMK